MNCIKANQYKTDLYNCVFEWILYIMANGTDIKHCLYMGLDHHVFYVYKLVFLNKHYYLHCSVLFEKKTIYDIRLCVMKKNIHFCCYKIHKNISDHMVCRLNVSRAVVIGTLYRVKPALKSLCDDRS